MNTETTQTSQTVKKAKVKTVKLKTDSLRVKHETKKKIQAEIAVLNRKDFGRPVTTDDYVALAITLLKPEDLEQLKDRSLSNRDRMEQKFQDYCAANGKVTKDEFLGLLLDGGKTGA